MLGYISVRMKPNIMIQADEENNCEGGKNKNRKSMNNELNNE